MIQMQDVSIKRKYIATLIVCIVFVMIVGSHSCDQHNKWTGIGVVVDNDIAGNGKLKFDENCDGKVDKTLTCKNVKLMPENYPDPKQYPSYAIGRYREKCAKFLINGRNEIIKWLAYPDRQACCAEPISRCDLCPVVNPSWAGLSNTIYPGSSPPYPADINVSSTPADKSATSGSKRDIAVDGTTRKRHVVWIETKNGVRDVYYACSLSSGSWVKTNVSQFPTEEGKKFQARNAALAVTPEGVPHIAWEVEIDNNNAPLTLEDSDNHYVYYVYGSSGCPPSDWMTCGGTYSPPLHSHTPGPGSYNDANVSRNDSNSSHGDAWNPAIALDNRDRPHITWQNETPYHTIFWVYCDDGAWKTCDGAVYHFESSSTCNAIVSASDESHYVSPSIAIDSENDVHIAYHSHNFQTSASSIYYVGISSGSTGYDCKQPICTGNSGKYASIAVDSVNNPHIVWEDGDIKHSHFSGATWSSPVIIPGTQGCHVPCLALDRDDNSHLVFYCNSNSNKEIFYSYNWSISNPPVNVSINNGNSFSPSIALDNKCNPHLLWTDETPAAEREVLYVHLWCCKWTDCGIIESKETGGMNLVKIEFYNCETGNTIMIYGDPNLLATNADDIDWSPSNSGTIVRYEDGLCAKYCLVEDSAGSLQIVQWEAVPPDDPCCCIEPTHCGCIVSLHYPKSSGIPINVEFLNECDADNVSMNFTIDSMLQAENNADYPGMNQHTMHDYLSQYPDLEMWCADIWVDPNDKIIKWEMYPDRDPCCGGCNQVCPCVENASPAPYCLLSNCDMQVLTSGDFGSPANAVWDQVNAIPCTEADESAWGRQACTDLPWTYLYEHGACWVYGNKYWAPPDGTSGTEEEYYKLEFKLEECSKLSFEAFIDDCAAFYIDGTGSAIYDSCEAGFQCAKHTFTSYCLEPGSHTLYIKHRDTRGHIYGLIFAAECIPCDCCCREVCGCFKKEAAGFLFYENCDFNNEPIVIGTGGNEPDIYEEFQSLEDYFMRYPEQGGWCARICIIDEDGEVSLQWWQALADEEPPGCCPVSECCEDWGIEIPHSSVNGENADIFFNREQCAAPGDEITFYRMLIKNGCDYDICVEVTSDIDDFTMYYIPGPPNANPITGPLIFEVPAGGSSAYLYGTFTMPECKEDELVNVMTLRQVECDTHRPIPDCEEKKVHVKCCGDTCCDYELIPITQKIPGHLCPGESWELTYKIKNNCPLGDDIEFNLEPGDGSVTVTPPGSFTVPGGGGTQVITVTYTMPGEPGAPCAIRSHIFKWALVTVGRDCPQTIIKHQIHCKSCLPCCDFHHKIIGLAKSYCAGDTFTVELEVCNDCRHPGDKLRFGFLYNQVALGPGIIDISPGFLPYLNGGDCSSVEVKCRMPDHCKTGDTYDFKIGIVVYTPDGKTCGGKGVKIHTWCQDCKAAAPK